MIRKHIRINKKNRSFYEKIKKTVDVFLMLIFTTEIFLFMQQLEIKATIPPASLVQNVKDAFGGPRNCMMYLLENNTLYAGGTPIYQGQLGTNTTGRLRRTERVNLMNVIGRVVKVEFGYNYALLLDDRGYVYATGRNNYGQLGMGDRVNLRVFTRIAFPQEVVIKDITIGALTSYALATNGDLYGWGAGPRGALAQGGNLRGASVNSIPKVIATDVTQVTASKSDGYLGSNVYNAVYIVKTDGRLYACGRNYYGQLGFGNRTDLTTFTNATFFNDKEIKQIQAGNARCFVLLEDGTAYACGDNDYGALGVNGSSTNGKTPGLSTNRGYVSTWAPIVIPNEYIIEELFRCSTSQMCQLSDGQVWGTGPNTIGALGFYSRDNTWNPNATGTRSSNKFLMTNICTLDQVDLNGNLRTLTPLAGGGGTVAQNHTDPVIYTEGPIMSLSGSYNECFMVDSEGCLRVSSDRADADTSTVMYVPDRALNPSTRVFHRMQSVERIIYDPEVEVSGHKSKVIIKVARIEEEIPVNPTTITMGPKQSDVASVYEKYIIYEFIPPSPPIPPDEGIYEEEEEIIEEPGEEEEEPGEEPVEEPGEEPGEEEVITKGRVMLTSTVSDAEHLVTNSPLTLDIETLIKDGTLPPGYYVIEVYRTSTIPTGEPGAGLPLESNHIDALFATTNLTLTYDPNTGTGTPPAEPTEYTYGSNIPILNNTFAKTGYEFLDWNTDPNGSGTSYNPGDTIMNIENNITLYARWASLSNIIVTFNVNEGDAVSPATKTVTFENQYGTLPTPTRKGYKFVNWTDAQTGGNVITETTQVSTPTDHTLYAQWIPVTDIIVTFDPNG